MNAYQSIKKVLEELVEKDISFSLNPSDDFDHGDYATNIAFIIAKQKGLSLKVCAEELLPLLSEKLSSVVERVEVAGPGFINFFLKSSIIRDQIVVTQESEIFVTKYTEKKVLVEHSSPNLFKPFSIGLLLNNIAGESLVHLMRSTGAIVTTMSFPSDISMGIAKAIYSIKSDGGLSQEIFSKKEEAIVAYLGESYAKGVIAFDDSDQVKIDVKEVAQKLYSETESEELEIFKKGKDSNLSYFKTMLGEIGSSFDSFVYESESALVGKELVMSRMDIFTKSEGAIVYIPEEGIKGVHTAVFINSQNNPTYEAKDLGLLDIKWKKYNPEYSFFVTDSEQISHFNVVLDAASKINPLWKEKSVHVYHGRMTFKGQKMSSRLGGVPLAKEILEVVREEVKERSSEKINHLSDEEKDTIYKQIALASLRFSMLRSKLGSSINFDPDTSLSFEGDSGPYVQYTHARAMSLITKGGVSGFVSKYSSEESVMVLERKLAQFESVVVRAIEEIAPQHIVTYLFELSQLFNSFYSSTPIVVEGDILSSHRLAITQSVAKVIKKGLYLLAVEAPERM